MLGSGSGGSPAVNLPFGGGWPLGSATVAWCSAARVGVAAAALGWAPAAEEEAGGRRFFRCLTMRGPAWAGGTLRPFTDTYLPSSPAPGRDASRCYEAMCEALPWRDRGAPLQLSFVHTAVYPPQAPPRPQVCRLAAWAGPVAGCGTTGGARAGLPGCRCAPPYPSAAPRTARRHTPHANTATAVAAAAAECARLRASAAACSCRPTTCGSRGWAVPQTRPRCCGAARRAPSRRRNTFSR